MLENLLLLAVGFNSDVPDMLQSKINSTSTQLNNIYMENYENYNENKANWGYYLESMGYQTDPSVLPYYSIENHEVTTADAMEDQVCTINYTAQMENNEYSVTGSGSCIDRDDYFKDDILKDSEEYRNLFFETLEKKTKKMRKATISKIMWSTVKELNINNKKKPGKKFMKKNQKIKLKNGMMVVSKKGKKVTIIYNSPLSTQGASCSFEMTIKKNKIQSDEIVSCQNR